MKPRLKTTFVLVLMLLSVLCYGQDKATNYVENEFIIWLEKGVDASAFATNSNAGIVPKRLLSERLNIWLFEITDSKGAREEKMRHLTTSADVRVIQNNHTNITLREAIPDDPYYDQQWAPAIMSLPLAWEEFTTGGITATGDTIVVAVIDGGADWTHEDLNCWINTREIPNNSIDDDHNGYVDDYHGWNAYNHNGYVGANRHGTHVAGIIGAVGDNGKGGALGDEFVGRLGETITALSPGVPGRIVLGDAEWDAVSATSIAAGARVRVTARRNLTLTVEAV